MYKLIYNPCNTDNILDVLAQTIGRWASAALHQSWTEAHVQAGQPEHLSLWQMWIDQKHNLWDSRSWILCHEGGQDADMFTKLVPNLSTAKRLDDSRTESYRTVTPGENENTCDQRAMQMLDRAHKQLLKSGCRAYSEPCCPRGCLASTVRDAMLIRLLKGISLLFLNFVYFKTPDSICKRKEGCSL